MSVEISSPFPRLSKRRASDLDPTICKRRLTTSPTPASPSTNMNLSSTGASTPQHSAKRRWNVATTPISAKRIKRMEDSSAEQTEEYRTFSTHQLDILEQKKQAEIARLRMEMEQYLLQKEQEYASCRQQVQEARSTIEEQAKEVGRLTEENKILRNAVVIQNQQKEEANQQVAVLQNLLQQAVEQVRRTEQSNYALRVHLQKTGHSGGYSGPPPDVF